MMTKRERVERTMAFQETARVPLYDLLRNDAAFAHFGGQSLPALSADENTVGELLRISGKATGAFLDMTRSVGFGPVEETDTTDEFGFVHHHSPREKTTWIVRRPFDDEAGAAQFLKAWILDRQEKTRQIESNPAAHRERFHASFLVTQGQIGDTVNLLTQHGVGLDSVRHLLGFELFTFVQVDQPGLISEALEAMTCHNIAECHAIADTELSPAVLTFSDIAYKDRLLHSPAYLRAEIFPRIKRLNAAWHEHGFKCLFHSDGYLMEVLDDLIEIGCDGLNPIETVAGMDLKEVREKCGQKLFLAGGIDMSQLMANGTPDEVRAVCEQAIADAYPGYLMGSTTESDNSCKLENLLAMHEVALAGV
ncbi:MAG TPA: uroporphyrinogen decarboxylase family protein [Candidatus Latescibacteria bacterium]|jgi:hypothetical protein|nr:hypothetical protein [Gemmatimonadaceae bacterium]MDP6015191.1 uroporphyrinogen decarboxylase family protein [Candidatus Latescibacterota bacterium]HJP33075.1 uroporphyrinogen decarboxylase family protein [Candidatus Latescibacterota bacterium]